MARVRTASTAIAPLALAVLLLSACASAVAPPPPPKPAAPPPAPNAPQVPSQNPVLPPPVTPPGAVLTFGDLPGWAREDHLAALKAFQSGCGVSKDPAISRVCALARAVKDPDAAAAQAFFEANFRPEAVGDQGLLTAYFAPEYPARMSRNAEFASPVRAAPEDLAVVDLGAFDPSLAGRKIMGRVAGRAFVPYPDRAEIEAVPTDKPLAWMRPEDLFFLQIQGSGVLALPDGRRVKAVFAGTNGRPFVGIAAPMRDKGLLPDNNTSGDAIRTWLAAHRGPEADAIMRLNPRYVFFKMAEDDGQEPVGSAGVSLPPGRAIAVDPGRHAYGALYWLDASAPALAGAFPVYRRLVVALDTGGAIKGDVRADLYLGRGPQAGAEAGRVRHALRLYRLVPTP
ncbi:MltA domain-containing protein [uncultured Caulobacter sp.]|uniref:MltA domain-containing protein n=1 Tax=uncultured Caulobacter sp. TaxID=158749 RepID=UPI002606B518|nr:MltA domain-containing protein [uncultured Caulobacter sp.]